jgi:hypothetical protein
MNYESYVIICIFSLIMIILMIMTVIMCDLRFNYQTEFLGLNGCGNISEDEACGDMYRISIEVTVPQFYAGTNIPMSDLDELSYIIELRETEESESNQVAWTDWENLNNAALPHNPYDQLAQMNNDRTQTQTQKTSIHNFYGSNKKLSRLLYYTMALENSFENLYGEVPTIVKTGEDLRHIFFLSYSANAPIGTQRNWNQNAKVRVGNYIHARITTVLKNNYGQTKTSDQDYARGVEFNDLLSISQIAPSTPDIVSVRIGLVMADGLLELIEANPRPVDEPGRLFSFVNTTEEGYLFVPSATHLENFEKMNTGGLGSYVEANLCERATTTRDGKKFAVIDDTEESNFQCMTNWTNQKYPVYSVLSQELTLGTTGIIDDHDMYTVVKDKLAMKISVRDLSPSIISDEYERNASDSTAPSTPIQRLVKRLIDKLLRDDTVGAIFISSTVLCQEFTTDVEGVHGVLSVQYKLFKNQIEENVELTAGDGEKNVDEYITGKDNYLDTSSPAIQDTYIKAFGWMGKQKQYKIRGTGRTTDKYIGGNSFPINVNDPETIKSSFKGHIYAKVITNGSLDFVASSA